MTREEVAQRVRDRVQEAQLQLQMGKLTGQMVHEEMPSADIVRFVRSVTGRQPSVKQWLEEQRERFWE